MKKLIVVGVLVGWLLVLGIAVGVASAQGPTPTAPTLAQMKAFHESVHGAGTWDAMAQAMEQYWGKDWFNQMHGPNGFMQNGGMTLAPHASAGVGGANGWNGNAPYGMTLAPHVTVAEVRHSHAGVGGVRGSNGTTAPYGMTLAPHVTVAEVRHSHAGVGGWRR